MSRRSPFRRGYIYRLYRKISFLAKRGTLLKSSSRVTRDQMRRGKKYISPWSFLDITLNSTFLFLLAYVLIFFLANLSTAGVAHLFGIPTILYYYDIDFIIKGVGWSADAVKVVYSTGPLAALIAAVILLIIYHGVTEETGLLKLLILWMAVHSLVFVFGEIMMGALFSKGFGYVLLYLYLPDTVLMVFTVFSMLVLVILGLVFSRWFVVSANIYLNDLPTFYIRKYLASQFLVPFLLGNVVIIAMKMPRISVYEICFNLSMIFLILPVVFRVRYAEDFRFDEDPRRIRLNPMLFILAALVLAGYRILLESGLRLF